MCGMYKRKPPLAGRELKHVCIFPYPIPFVLRHISSAGDPMCVPKKNKRTLARIARIRRANGNDIELLYHQQL